MERRLFNNIVVELKKNRDFRDISAQYGVQYETLLSISSQKYQQMTRQTLHRHRTPQNMARYYEQYCKGCSILALADRNRIAPCLLARIVLQCHLGFQMQHQKRAPSKAEISRCLRDTSLIQDERLRKEVAECVLKDTNYSPLVEKIRRSIGLEYEYVLQEKLHNLSISFLSEEEMRKVGFPRTPDVKLLEPCVVEGHIVHWIESKASFGDDYSHRINCEEQFYGYSNRFVYNVAKELLLVFLPDF